MKKIFSSLLIIFLLLLTACKSLKTDETKKPSQPEEKQNVLIKYPGTMLWEIDGYTDQGEPSKVYLLGTYHAGDGRMDQFPEPVAAALKESDRFCCELSSEVWAVLPDLMNDLTMNSLLTDLSHTLIDELTNEEITLVSKYVDANTLASLVCFEPWVLNNYLQTVVMMASGLDTQKAYDIMIMNDIAQNRPGTSFDGLDDVQVQLDLTAYGDWNTQMIMLRDSLEDLKDLTAAVKEITDLYEVFLSGDEAAFEQAYFKDVKPLVAQEPVYAQYIKELLDDRNAAWAVKIEDYLNTPGTTFVFAGCAHFVGDASVFEYLRQNTVLK